MSRKVNRILLVLVMVLLINLPIVHSTWVHWRVEHSGRNVSAHVVSAVELPPRSDPGYFVGFTFPREVDPAQRQWTAEVDPATYQRAKQTLSIEVRVLPGHPSEYAAEGQVVRHLGQITTALADVFLVVMLLLIWRYGDRFRRPPLKMVAVEGVQRCPPGSALDRIEGTLYLIRGEISARSDDEITLDLGDRKVVVLLDGNPNPVGYQQPAQVRARMIG